MQRRTGARHGQGGRGRRETSIGMPVAKTGWPLVAASIGHALIACSSLHSSTKRRRRHERVLGLVL